MMKYVILALVIIVFGSALIEKKPGGGFRISRKIGIFSEFWYFIRERKLWWMTPILLVLVLLAIFIWVTESSVVLPFIYAVF